MKLLQIEPKHLKILEVILEKYDLDIYAFGSRTKQMARAFSDLDLAIKGQPEKRLIRKLQDDFEESNLPFKVDIVVWDELEDSFKTHIEGDLLKITFL